MTTPTPESLSDQDKIDLAMLGDSEAAYHTILEAWREVLRPAATEREKKVSPQWANRMLAGYMGLTYADMNDFRDRYYTSLEQLLDILLNEIDSDPEALTYADPTEDAEHNAHHYKNLLLNWQTAILSWELAWECTAATAAVEIAVISEIHKMFLGPQGLVAWLENISFVFSDEDQADLSGALIEFREHELAREEQ